MTKRYYNVAGDLLVTASACMKQGKTKKALECAELALQIEDMDDIVMGLKNLNSIASSEIDDEEIDIEEEVKDDKADENADDVEEAKAKKVEDDEELDEAEIDALFEEESKCKKCKAEDEEVEEEVEDDEIDDEELDEVLSSLRNQFKVTSSIKTKPALASKVGSLLRR